jgi:hypothetical protein
MALRGVRLVFLSVLLVTGLRAQFLTTGIQTTTLSLTGVNGSTPMNIAWHPGFEQYYGGRGGSTSYGGIVWNASGGVVQNLSPINTDIRSFFYNPNTGRLENITYAAYTNASGYRAVVLTGAGLFTGTYTDVGVTLSGLPMDQVAPAYDAARNLLYAYNSGNTVSVVSPVTGLLVNTITLDFASAGSPTLPYYVIGYDPYNDALISYTATGGIRAVAFSASTGAFLASVTLPGLTQSPDQWRMGYANNQLFVFDNTLDSYIGYTISAVPEPGTTALLATGLLLIGIVCRRRIHVGK